MSGTERIDELHLGFRRSYLDYATLTAQLEGWAEAFPDLVRLTSLGRTEEGREIWMLVLGPDPDRVRPTAWVDGNLHAVELAGSSVALAIAEDVLRLHLNPDGALHGLPAHQRAWLAEVLFHVVPRISPDGAEAVLKTGRYVRSVPRDLRPNRAHARWRSDDVDGDGLALLMRVEDSGGEFVESREVPGLMLGRRPDDPGPYYKLYPEGFVTNFDGATVPDPDFLQDNAPDLNRNFPHSWVAEPEQVGAGDYPGSEPESRALVEHARKTPQLFAWLNLHTFGGVFIRPLGHKPDAEMDRSDLALFRQIEAWGTEHTGYPMVSGFEEFVYEPNKPIHGDLSDFAYHQRGCVSYVCELWDLFHRLGVERKKPFVDAYTHLTREDMVKLGRWDREVNAGRTLVGWRAADHPQLGRVEVGGVDMRVGMWNPPYELLDEVCRGQSAVWLRVASLVPRVRISRLESEPLAEGLFRVTAVVENEGYLPTHILSSAKKLTWNEPVHAEVSGEGCELAADVPARREVGHLEGWGRGLYDGSDALYFQRSSGTGHRRTLHWTVRGEGKVTVQAGSCRVGWVSRTIEVG